MLEFRKIEEEVLKFWEKNKIYEKSKRKNARGKKFYFLQGPPYTSGKIHVGHAWNNSLKDIAMRYKRMKGFNVWDRAGYDMHGLPTENAVQKKLGLKTKEEIAKYGVKRFVKECMDFSVKHAELMNDDLKRFGIWMDFENAYMPIKKEFISGQWAFFKKADEQKRLYKGTKVMHWDAETETSLAKHELEYKMIKDKSIYLKFRKKNSENEYFVIWTTTPWTIPFNLAIMANPDVDYVKAKVAGSSSDIGKSSKDDSSHDDGGHNEYWIIAKDLVDSVSKIADKKFKIVEEFKGKKLEGQEYEHFLDNKYEELKEKWSKVHSIILSKQYVDTSAGTGLVHCAPGCGPEDEEVARGYGIGSYNSLNEQGKFEDGEFKGLTAKTDDDKLINYFKDKGYLIASTIVEHDYPHSWRSHKPVIFRATEQWFLKTKDLVPKLLKFNKDVYWVPKKSGESYDRWAENLRDNSVVRQRFWGCPIPIWVNENDYIVIGSVQELEKLTGKKFDDLSLHKPWIDDIVIEKNGKKYKRVLDVCDVWIDSGTASWNCLDNNPKLLKEYFPADLVLEATEQTKLWFSLLQICSSIMFNKSCYQNVFVHGMIFDFQGTKMSKSIGNIISPYEVVDKFSSDIFRYYICEITAGENISFNWEDIKQKQRNLIVLVNIGNYLKDFLREEKIDKIDSKSLGVEEKYILSRTNSTLKKVEELFENYNLDKTIVEIEDLFLDLSRVYIKIIRDKANNDKTRKIVLNVILDVYVKVLKMFSCICPLVSDKLWQDLRGLKVVKEESVHLCDWPDFDKKKIDEKLEKEFETTLEIIEKGLAERDKEKIGLKWPLSKAIVSGAKVNNEMLEIVKSQLNVKDVEIVGKGSKDPLGHTGKEIAVKLDTKMTPELEAEGYAREISRKVQAARKKAGFVKSDKIKLGIVVDDKFSNLIESYKEFLGERVNAVSVEIGKVDGKYKHEFDEKIKDKKVKVLFSKV